MHITFDPASEEMELMYCIPRNGVFCNFLFKRIYFDFYIVAFFSVFLSYVLPV